MSFSQFAPSSPAVQILQRSLARGRLAHAYLFCGHQLPELEQTARILAQTVNCQSPTTDPQSHQPIDCCDECAVCRRIAEHKHPDIQWIRPESKSRIITIDQIRSLCQTIFLKPLNAAYKVAILTAADRLNPQAANAFLKTLEEPPPCSLLILLTTNPPGVLETIQSRCLHLAFTDTIPVNNGSEIGNWLRDFAEIARNAAGSLLDRYRLLGIVSAELAQTRVRIQESFSAQSPLEHYDDVDPSLRDKWGDELLAAIEGEYRRQRTDMLAAIQGWLRDIWLLTCGLGQISLLMPSLQNHAKAISSRLPPIKARENLEIMERTLGLLNMNTQENLVLEVAMIKLNL